MITDMGKTPLLKLLFRLAPPVMLALLIQSVYYIMDSCFIARYSADGFTALLIFYLVQRLMLAFAARTGIGINILVQRMDCESGWKNTQEQNDVAKSSMFLGLLNYVIFTALGLYFLQGFYNISSSQAIIRSQGIEYARIVGPIPIFWVPFGYSLKRTAQRSFSLRGTW